jgi:hypothetical protein
VHTTLGASNFRQYTVPTSNWYAVLSNHFEPLQLKVSTFSSNFGQPSGCRPNISNNHSKRYHWKKSPSTTQNKRSTPHLFDNHNVQEFRKNEDETSPIPTTVNGVTYMNSNPKHGYEDSDVTSDSINHLINNLQDTINVHDKVKHSPSKKHIHVRGYVGSLKPLPNSDYDLYSVVKPGCGSNELQE